MFAPYELKIFSGDFHHIFIEKFDLKNGNDLRMWTGS